VSRQAASEALDQATAALLDSSASTEMLEFFTW
jgi:hypothetical protein